MPTVHHLEPDHAAQWRRDIERLTRAPWAQTTATLIALAYRHLPAATLDAIAQLNDPGRPREALVHNLPTRGDHVDELLLISLIEASNYRVYAFREQNNGDLVQTVTPQPGRETSRSNAGSVELSWHTDDAILPRTCRAEIIALECIVNDGHTPTRYLPTYELIRHLEPETIALLTEARYHFPTPESFTLFGGKRIYSEPRPILTPTPSGDYEIACALYNVEAHTGDPDATHALTELRHAATTATPRTIALQPGDCLIISNIYGLHARDTITAPRTLKRVYGRHNLTDLAPYTTSTTTPTYTSEPLVLL